MRFKFSLWLAISLWGVVIPIMTTQQASASTPLTRAEIQSLRNFVQLLQRSTRSKRKAKRADTIIPGDGISTGRASLADLRFNDGSLARIGEQAIFQFLPRTRNFRLSNGTALLLIPPGRGQTQIQTPSATAAIRGSALFVRYDEQTDTTVVGALTNSGIVVSNKDGSQAQELQAGQLIVVVKGRFQGLYDFDLQNFYQTSDLVQGLDLTRQNLTSSTDPAIASVQAEVVAALAGQTPLSGQDVIENPAFLELTANSGSDNQSNDLTANSNNSSMDSFFDTGEILFNNAQDLANRNDNRAVVENNVVSIPVSTPTIPVTTININLEPIITEVTQPTTTQQPTTPEVIQVTNTPVVTQDTYQQETIQNTNTQETIQNTDTQETIQNTNTQETIQITNTQGAGTTGVNLQDTQR
ncbi:iron dicitrate transport regulator FecR [Nostoc sp. CENA543]|uniref:FecR family protein n=1 Tax=Nostoc sp. CENA543 TaxID=1869241 RepID=UPI000CA136FA|nr:FecR family protein [Nostoc sp. CENA543]AUT01480.1 iron dicitrate transport regulator FecR [Nostoc sp. CENA543]